MLGKLSFCCSSLGFDSKTSILGFVILLLLWKLIARNRTTELLSKLPGPKAFPLVGNIREALLPRAELFRQLIQRTKIYGSIYVMWLGRTPVVWLSDPTYIEEILHSSNHLNKGFSYRFVEPFLGTGLITANRNKWLKQRKILTPTFHFKILDSFFGVFRENSKTLLNLLDAKAEIGKPFDFYSYANNYAMDNICEAAMGVKVESQTDKGSDYARTAMRLSELIVERINKIWLSSDVIYHMTASGKEFLKLRTSAYAFVDNVISERKKILQERKLQDKNDNPEVDDFGIKRRLAFLDVLLESAEKENIQLSIEDIRDEVNTFMFAGHDTTTAAIVWAIYLIGLHPKVQEEMYKEQRDLYGDDMERPIAHEDLSRMELLERVMKESIRLFPSVPLIARKLDADIKFGKYVVPKNVTVVVDIYNLHRNPSVYAEPNKFDPDRFLPDNTANRHSYAYVPFSAGPRNCIGRRFALLEEKLTIASLIRRYEIISTLKMEDLTLVAELILRSKTGMPIILKKRINK